MAWKKKKEERQGKKEKRKRKEGKKEKRKRKEGRKARKAIKEDRKKKESQKKKVKGKKGKQTLEKRLFFCKSLGVLGQRETREGTKEEKGRKEEKK